MSLAHLFGKSDDHPKFTTLKELHITSSTMDGNDVMSLSNPIECGKFHKLWKLNFPQIHDDKLEDEVENLRQACKKMNVTRTH